MSEKEKDDKDSRDIKDKENNSRYSAITNSYVARQYFA
jgi:hypothetical protein